MVFSLGNWEDPPCWEKFPNNPVTFFEGVPQLLLVNQLDHRGLPLLVLQPDPQVWQGDVTQFVAFCQDVGCFHLVWTVSISY